VNVKRILSDDCAGPNAPHEIVFCNQFTACLSQGLDDFEGALSKHYGCAV
jgi:hypothetical protein